MQETGDPPRTVAILVHPGFGLSTFAGVMDLLFVANWLARRTLYQSTVVSVAGGSIPAYNGMAIDTVPIDDLPAQRVDAIFVVASSDPTRLSANAFLRAAYRHGARVVGMETGGVALAKAGLLTGRDAAIHWTNHEGFEEMFSDVTLTNAPLAVSGRCLTCAGGVALPDLAVEFVGSDAGPDLARAVAAHLAARAGDGDGSKAAGWSPLVADTIRIMSDNLESPIPCHDLAERAGVARRTLERRFLAQTGRTPGTYYLDLRLTRAQNLLQQTAMAVSEVAVETGFESLPAFSRAYRNRFGLPPSKDRAQTVVASVPRHPWL